MRGTGRARASGSPRLPGLSRPGADLVLLCTNTVHIVADQPQAVVEIPLLHLVDTTAAAVRRDGLAAVGLLGTAFTMEPDSAETVCWRTA